MYYIIHSIYWNPEQCLLNKNITNLYFYEHTHIFPNNFANFTAEKTRKVDEVHTMLIGGRHGMKSLFFPLKSSALSSTAELPSPTEHFHSQMGRKPGSSGPSFPTTISSMLSILQNYNLVPLTHL